MRGYQAASRASYSLQISQIYLSRIFITGVRINRMNRMRKDPKQQRQKANQKKLQKQRQQISMKKS